MSSRDQLDQFRLESNLPSSTRMAFRWCLWIGLGISALAGLALIWVQPIIPLLYSVTDPNQQLVSKWWILLFPGLSILFTSLHFLLARLLKDWAEIIIRLIAWSTVALQVILALTIVRIIWVIL